MTDDPHADHRKDAVLSITDPMPDGGQVHQSWPMCECVVAALRATLGPPVHEIYATREQADATGEAVLAVPLTHVMHTD